MDALLAWETNLVLAFQSVYGLDGIMSAFTFLGNEEFFLFVMPLLYWCLNAGLGARTAVMLIASNGLADLLKLSFALPRPYWIDPRVTAFTTEVSYAQPSSHTMNATAVWSFLAAQARRRWAWPAAIVLIVMIALSRVYLGVHFPSNLMGGWLLGGALVWAGLRWESRVVTWLTGLGVWRQIGLALAAALAYLALTLAVLAIVPAPAALPQWEATAARAAPPAAGERAIDPRGLESPVTTSGMIFGLGAGLALAARGARFDAGGPAWKRAARFVVGVAGTAVLFLGLRALFPHGEDLGSYAFRALRYAVVIIWALYAAPWAFLKTGLAAPASARG